MAFLVGVAPTVLIVYCLIRRQDRDMASKVRRADPACVAVFIASKGGKP